MKKILSLLILLAVLSSVSCLVGCRRGSTETNEVTGTPAVTSEDSSNASETENGGTPDAVLEIGGLIPAYEGDALLGAELAVEEINSLGGVKLSLGTDPDNGEAPLLSIDTSAAYGEFTANYIARGALGMKLGVIVQVDDDFSVAAGDAFKQRASSVGLNVVCSWDFMSGETDLSVQVSKAKAAGADAVFLPVEGEYAARILTEADKIGYLPFFFGISDMANALSEEGFNTECAEGALFAGFSIVDEADGRSAEFAKKYTAKHPRGKAPDEAAAGAYDTVYAVYEATKKAGITQGGEGLREKLSAAVSDLESPSVLSSDGILRWNADGKATPNGMQMFVIQSGEPVKY